MPSSLSRYRVLIACVAFGAMGLRPAAAQHHGGHGSSHHGSSHYGSSHHGGGHVSSHFGGGHHSGWSHVVPTHDHHAGLYYSYGGANYYTPAPPVQVRVLRPQIDAGSPYSAPPTPPMAPLAPQSVKLVFGGFQQTEDLSSRLEIEANRWCVDMHYNYAHNPDFAATYRDAYKILLAAKYVHSSEHRQDREAIRTELARVEPLFHQVQEKIKTWTRQERRPVGEGGINGKAEVVESILHHLLFDVGVKAHHDAALEEQAPAPAEEASAPVAD